MIEGVPDAVENIVLDRYSKRCQEMTNGGCKKCAYCGQKSVTNRLEVEEIPCGDEKKGKTTTCVMLVHKCETCKKQWTCEATEEYVDSQIQQQGTIEEKKSLVRGFCLILRDSVDYYKLSDTEFRELVRATLPLVADLSFLQNRKSRKSWIKI